jgi:hypothetical protein
MPQYKNCFHDLLATRRIPTYKGHFIEKAEKYFKSVVFQWKK